jgi:hypothetical protein
VTLTGPASAGGAVVSLSSSDPLVAQVPANITVLENATTASFTVTTSSVAVDTVVTITATYASTVRTALLTVTVIPTVELSLSLNPATVTGGNPSTGTVTLGTPAPAGGATVTLTSGAPTLAQVPANVIVPSGELSATFSVSTSPVGTLTQITITADYDGANQGAALTLLPAGMPVLFSDDFTDPPGADPLWVSVSGTWAAAGGIMSGSSPVPSYGYLNVDGDWTD